MFKILYFLNLPLLRKMNLSFIKLTLGYRSQYRDSVWAGRSGNRIPVWERFPAPVQTGSGSYPSSSTMGIGSFRE